MPTPSGIAPVNGATINTNLPLLEMIFASHTKQQKAEWQFASDAGFTASIRTITQANAKFTSSLYASETVPGGSALTQGTWYLRGRAIDSDGVPSDWTATNTVTVTHPPSATNLDPSSDESVAYGTGDIVHDWTFFDTSPDDAQTAYELQIERNSDGLSVLATGKVVSGTTQHTQAISGTYNNTRLRWRVRLWDLGDVVGPWTPWETYWLADLPVVAITSPVDATVLDTPAPSVAWSLTMAPGRTQSAYRVRFTRTSDSVVVHDSGWTASATQNYQPPSILANNQNYTVTVDVKDDLGNVGSDSNAVSTSWVAPDTPVLVIDADIFTRYGYVHLSWSNASEDGSFVRYDLYRRRPDQDTDELIHSTTTAQAGYALKDWLAASNVVNEYRLVQAATRFGAEVESDSPTRAILPYSDSYWLLVDGDPDLTVELYGTTSDDFTEEYEEQTHHIIGRGRKKDVGDRLGFSGSLNLQLRDRGDLTARAQQQRIRDLKTTTNDIYLRNPFGDLWMVAPGGISVSRMAGVGNREFADLQVAYEEISP